MRMVSHGISYLRADNAMEYRANSRPFSKAFPCQKFDKVEARAQAKGVVGVQLDQVAEFIWPPDPWRSPAMLD